MNRLFVIIFLIQSMTPVFGQVKESNFISDAHPRIFVGEKERISIISKIETTDWAQAVYRKLHDEVDPILKIHRDNPSYVVSRMQMHWEEGKRYTNFATEGNFVTRRWGNAKYPTVRVTYGRAASNSVPLAPLDKIIPYGDGSLTKPHGKALGIVKLGEEESTKASVETELPYDTIPFSKTGLGTETHNRYFVHLAWKSAILFYLTQNKDYAKLCADIIWNFVRGAAQQQQLNPEQVDGINGYLSFETLGDTRHFATLPLAYDMIYDYLYQEYFSLSQFTEGIPGELWAPAHLEGKEWALSQFEIMFKRLIENKLTRGGGLQGNWNMNEQQSAMLYALALDADSTYTDGKGRAYYVNKLIYGPTTPTHGAYKDVLRANISPVTGLWPEALGGYGQGSTQQLVNFGYIYYKNGIDMLETDTLLSKASMAMPQMIFPNGYVTNVGDASYSRIFTDQLELLMAYATDKGNTEMLNQAAALMQFVPERNFSSEFFFPLFFYLAEVPKIDKSVKLNPTSYSANHSIIFERNMAEDPRNALAFTLSGFGKNMGHRQPGGMSIELYGRGHILAPDQGIGADYWSRDTREYKINVAGHNTVAPNGCGADNNMPQDLEIVCAEPAIIEGADTVQQLSFNHQYVETHNHFYTNEVKAEQRRAMAIIRTSQETGYFIDIFHSALAEGADLYHDYIYHNMGEFENLIGDNSIVLDNLSGKGYGYFSTIASASGETDTRINFSLGVDDTHTSMFILGGKERTVYQLSSPNNHRYYLDSLRHKPVPAILIRQKGEAWERPFVAVFEPSGNGATSVIKAVRQEKTIEQPNVAKFTVELMSGRKDHIMHSTDISKEIKYRNYKLKGHFAVVTEEPTSGKPISIYIVSATYFRMKGLKVTSKSGEPFSAYLQWDGNSYICQTKSDVLINN